MGYAIFVDYVIRFIASHPEEDRGSFYDALSANSQFFIDEICEVSNYEIASEDSVSDDDIWLGIVNASWRNF